MPLEIYEVVAQGARYWFLFLMAIIVWRSYRWLAKDRRQRKKRLKLLPDAGFVGEMVVQSGNGELLEGTVLLVPREGLLGTLRGCDLFVPVRGIAKKHLWFRYEDDHGLMVKTFSGRRMGVDGEEYAGSHKAAYMRHGSRLYVGEAVLRLRMFAGFETTGRAVQLEEAAAEREAPMNDQNQAAAMAQMATWQEQQRAMQRWFLSQQEAQAQADDDEFDGYEDEPYDDDETAFEEAYPEPQEFSQGYIVLTDSGVSEQSARPSRARSLFNPFASAAEEHGSEAAAQETIFAPTEAFFPPVQEEGNPDMDDVWPYAEYPQSGAVFENNGYTYPEAVQSEDEDLTDAAAAPKSMYIEPDEAERAKRLLWDKYLGGGPKR